MANPEVSTATLLDKLASVDPQVRSELAATLRQVSNTFAEVPDGKTASYVLSIFAHLLDAAFPVPK